MAHQVLLEHLVIVNGAVGTSGTSGTKWCNRDKLDLTRNIWNNRVQMVLVVNRNFWNSGINGTSGTAGTAGTTGTSGN
jgi:hypothetical protein